MEQADCQFRPQSLSFCAGLQMLLMGSGFGSGGKRLRARQFEGAFSLGRTVVTPVVLAESAVNVVGHSDVEPAVAKAAQHVNSPSFPLLAHTAGGGNRTHTLLPEQDFESCASANSATPANLKCSVVPPEQDFEPACRQAGPARLPIPPFRPCVIWACKYGVSPLFARFFFALGQIASFRGLHGFF